LLAFFAAIMIVMIIVSCDGGHEMPQDVLKTRYARGQIAKDEFEQLKQDLKE
jgi:uncharacterized membrane protein